MKPKRGRLRLGFICAFLFYIGTLLAVEVRAPWFGIQVVDEQTGRGVPLIELRTVNDVRCVTDSAGWIAFQEPGLMGRELWFYLSHAPGYDMKPDGFGYRGVRVRTEPGQGVVVKVQRVNVAERLCRLTGQGIYRDSELLGLPVPVPSLGNGGVMGSDSVQAVPYRGKIYWLWGDTNVPHYPLGNFQTTAAWTPTALQPEQGIVYDYLVDSARPSKLRHQLPLEATGAVWLFGLLTLPSEQGEEVMLAHYSRHRSLSECEEHGLAQFDEKAGHFRVVKVLPDAEKWRFPRGHAVHSGGHYYFSDGFLHTRVKAELAALLDPAVYEALAFIDGQWRWQRELPPTTQDEETRLLLSKAMRPDQARYRLKDRATQKLVRLHGGSVQWNEYRHCWVLIGLQKGDKEDPSPLGEIWYAESATPEGPWAAATKVVSHPRYSYYNPIHHDFLDAEQGRIIYFEGTYTLEFSGNPLAPARYDYNQLMYRLDLGDPRLRP